MHKSIYSDDYQHFLRELKDVRFKAGVSQEKLATALNEHQTFISKVERGVRRLDVVELRLWLEALDAKFPDFCELLDQRLAQNKRPSPAGRRR